MIRRGGQRQVRVRVRNIIFTALLPRHGEERGGGTELDKKNNEKESEPYLVLTKEPYLVLTKGTSERICVDP